MGTNFYWYPPDHKDDEEEPLHIGKRSGAGGGLLSYSFQGHREGVDTKIDSWAKWKACLLSGGHVRDEYDQVIDTQEFIAQVEATTPENRRRQFDWMRDHGYPLGPEGDWLCDDGFSFTYKDFC